MTERVETVRLLMNISNYLANAEQARLATAKLAADSTTRLAAQRQAFTQAGLAITAIGVVAAAAVAVSVAKFAEFDQAMSNVKAVTQESTANMGLLREAALEAGASTIFTATEAANAIEELGKAGLTTTEILGGGLKESLALAASGQLGIARAAEITATTLKQFNLEGKDAGRVADTLSAGAGKALGSVEDLAQGLKFVGPVAHSMGISLEETTGTLALFASQGILGEQAGTGLRGMLSSLTSPSKLARDEISRLGITLYDSNGKFLGLENAAGQLQGAFKGLTDEQRDFSLGQIFGNAQVTEARILYQAGAKGVADWTAAVTDSGYAAQVSRDRLDNLKGDIEKLGGAFDTFAIQSGSGANDTLRAITQTLTFLLDVAAQLPAPVTNTGLAVGAVAAIVATSTGVFLSAIPKYLDLKNAMLDLNISGGKAARGIALASGAVSVAVGLFAFFATTAAEAAQKTEEVKESLDQTTGAVTKYTRAWVAKSLAESEWVRNSAQDVGLSVDEITDAIINGGDQLDAVQKKFTGQNNIVNFFNGSGVAAGNASQTIRELAAGLKSGREQFEVTKDAVADNTEALAELSGSAAQADEDVSKLADTIRGFGSAQLDVNSATRAFEAAVDDLTSSLDENGATLDVGTEQGRANQAALDDIAKSTLNLAAATIEQTGKQEDANATIAAGRDALIDALAQFGITGQAAEDYADNLGLIPDSVSTAVSLSTTRAQQEIDSFAAYAASRLNLVAYIRTVDGRADGGPIFGVGGPRQDNIPIMASVGEHMLNAEDVKRLGGHAGVYAFRRSLYLADGGPVVARPTYVQAPNYMWASPTTAPSSSETKVDVNVTGVDSTAAAEMVYQRLQAGLTSR